MARPEFILNKIKQKINTGPYVKTKRKPFEILISTILSQRTRDGNTSKASRQLFGKYDTLEKLAKANTNSIKKLIKPSGFYNVKSKRIKEISNILIENYNGKVPKTENELLQLPGVGRKTANIVLSFAFDKNVIAVDTHVHRIANRIGMADTKNPKETEQKLMKKVNNNWQKKLNPLLVRFGQKICKPRKPECPKCPVNKWCDYYKSLH